MPYLLILLAKTNEKLIKNFRFSAIHIILIVLVIGMVVMPYPS